MSSLIRFRFLNSDDDMASAEAYASGDGSAYQSVASAQFVQPYNFRQVDGTFEGDGPRYAQVQISKGGMNLGVFTHDTYDAGKWIWTLLEAELRPDMVVITLSDASQSTSAEYPVS
ncbi:MAG: hypothetical protein ACYTG6_17895 [Planctomycetota bacterium]|jgi:hypothetical protein